MNILLKGTGLAVLLAAGGAAFAGTPLEGRWDAQLIRNEQSIPFRLDISGEGATLKGTLYDGFRPYEYTTGASYQDGKLVLNIEHYLTTINAKLENGKLVGDVHSQNRGQSADYTFVATRYDATAAAAAARAKAPSIAGDWGDSADFAVFQGREGVPLHRRAAWCRSGRVDPARGRGHGRVQRRVSRRQVDALAFRRFAAGRHRGYAGVPKARSRSQQRVDRPGAAAENAYGSAPDGRYSPEADRLSSAGGARQGTARTANHLAHTTARDPNEKFAFNFPDLEGKVRTQDDADFKGSGRRCHRHRHLVPQLPRRAQYLVQLDKKYRAKGLRIVALNFEEVEQQESQQRAKAFVKQYGVKYPYLLAGAPEEMWEKVPQLVNLNTWPATVFVGRDGTVRAVHAGFASPSTGDFRAKQDKEFESRIQQLLAEKVPVDTRVSAR